jgi:hypothetical protein
MPLAIKQVAFNLVDQDIPTPAALDRLPNVPLSLLCIFYAVQNPDLVTPRQLNNTCCSNSWSGYASANAQTFQVPASKSTHFRERFGQVLRQAINDFCAPSFILLATQDVTANAPIKDYKFPVYRKSRPNLG